MHTSRRSFVERVTGGAVLLATTPWSLGDPLREIEAATSPTFADTFDMSWAAKVTGKHKAVLDVPEIESGYGVWRAGITKKQLMDVMKAPAKDVSMVLVLRHNAIVLAMTQAYWDAFDVGKETKTTHPADGTPTQKNPALLDAKAGLPARFDGLSVPQFIAGGGIVLACDLALTLDIVPKFKARDKSTDDAAHKAAVASLIPGVILQPSGVFAAIRAQQAGCTYVRAS
jgi:hypothetical protein